MPILTLTTDWGLRDHYLASFKGELISLMPFVQLIDISHDVEKFNTMQAAFIIQNSYLKFPKGTIHFIGISSNENSQVENPYVIVKSNGQFLIGEDNGIFTLILGKQEKEIVRLPFRIQSQRNELHDSMLLTIKNLFDGVDPNSLGETITSFQESYFAQPTVDNNAIRGTVIYIDSFGNAVVNISRELFFKEQRGRNFEIYLRKSTYNVSRISMSYDDVDVGEMLALFNQDGFLEIALNKDSAGKLLGLKLMDTIRIEFNDNTTG